MFRAWMDLFGENASPRDAYDLLTPGSRARLRQKWSIGSKDQFAAWFESLRSSETPPFHYRFSRIDIQDIALSDTRATVTATFLLRDRDRTSDEIGSFYLLKQGDSWRVPFAESGDWISSWWERGASIQSNTADENSVSYRSELLGIRIRYPRTWDIAPEKRFSFPNLPQPLSGVELTCTPEEDVRPAILIRIAAESVPEHAPAAAGDSLSSGGAAAHLIGQVDSAPEQLWGKLFRVSVPGRAGTLLLYAAAYRDPALYARYETVIQSIIHSIATLHD